MIADSRKGTATSHLHIPIFSSIVSLTSAH